MKYLYLTNKFALIATFILYLTFYLGLYAQIVLGGLQVISALILFAFWKEFKIETKKMIGLYWLVTLIYGLCWYFNWNPLGEDLLLIVGIIIIPMSIACYFLYILNKLKSSR